MATTTAEQQVPYSSRRIYVASLSDYNSGTLHGVWIDTETNTTAENIEEEVKKMLADSPESKLCQWDGVGLMGHRDNANNNRPERCRGWLPGNAEEWAIHDHEGYPRGFVGEYTSFTELEEFHDAIEDVYDAGALAAYLETADSGTSMGDKVAEFVERYRGEFASGEAFAENFYDETGQMGDDNPLLGYINWESVWHGEFDCAGYHAADAPNGNVYIFDGSY